MCIVAEKAKVHCLAFKELAKMQSCTSNFKEKAFVLKLDISGYFMNMNKDLLFSKVVSIINKNELFCQYKAHCFIYLVTQNIYHDPTTDCKFQSHKKMEQFT